MNTIMTELHQDHVHLSRLLDIMDEQLVILSTDGDPDLSLMSDIVNYIQHYPDLVHHPKEDQVYKVFRERSDHWNDEVDALLKEHHNLPETTLEFFRLLEGAANGSLIVSRDELSERVERFVKLQRAHMSQEENNIFPVIEKTLTDEDWAKVEKNLIRHADPLFGSNVEDCYKNLYQSINS